LGITPTLESLAADLAARRTTSRALIDACLARIDEPGGQGAVAFLQVDRDAARCAADAMDALREANAAPSRFAGMPIAVKDLGNTYSQRG
jgi:aspartyl-tRNA(Asn)/glutamyl-tRNA(Gln) amidotransferase subunit A